MRPIEIALAPQPSVQFPQASSLLSLPFASAPLASPCPPSPQRWNHSNSLLVENDCACLSDFRLMTSSSHLLKIRASAYYAFSKSISISADQLLRVGTTADSSYDFLSCFEIQQKVVVAPRCGPRIHRPRRQLGAAIAVAALFRRSQQPRLDLAQCWTCSRHRNLLPLFPAQSSLSDREKGLPADVFFLPGHSLILSPLVSASDGCSSYSWHSGHSSSEWLCR